MTDRPSGEVERSVGSLAEIKFSEETLDSMLGRVGDLGVAALQGWDAAATCLVERDRVATFGVTDDRIKDVDQQQYDTGKGPCVDAMKTGEIQYFNGTSVEPRWRQFAETAADHDIYSVLSFPLRIDGEMRGALNFYSRERDAARPGQREEGSVFAAQAAVALANVKEMQTKEQQIGQLEEGLQTRTMIGQATGLLMAQEGLTSEEAFQKLVKVSQASNVKLREIAQRYVESWETKATSDA